MNEKDRLSEEAIANKRRYDLEYIKQNYKYFSISAPKEEVEDIKKTIKQHGFAYVDFLRLCIKLLKEGKIKKED